MVCIVFVLEFLVYVDYYVCLVVIGCDCVIVVYVECGVVFVVCEICCCIDIGVF